MLSFLSLFYLSFFELSRGVTQKLKRYQEKFPMGKRKKKENCIGGEDNICEINEEDRLNKKSRAFNVVMLNGDEKY